MPCWEAYRKWDVSLSISYPSRLEFEIYANSLCSYETLGDWFCLGRPPTWPVLVVMVFIFNPPGAGGIRILHQKPVIILPSFLPLTFPSLLPFLPTKDSERLRTVTVKALGELDGPQMDSIPFFCSLRNSAWVCSPLDFKDPMLISSVTQSWEATPSWAFILPHKPVLSPSGHRFRSAKSLQDRH